MKERLIEYFLSGLEAITGLIFAVVVLLFTPFWILCVLVGALRLKLK